MAGRLTDSYLSALGSAVASVRYIPQYKRKRIEDILNMGFFGAGWASRDARPRQPLSLLRRGEPLDPGTGKDNQRSVICGS